MTDDRETLTAREDELASAEEQYQLWEWVRAAGVSVEDLKKVLQSRKSVLASSQAP